MDTQIIDDFSAVRLLINVYMIKKLKSSFRPVKQEKFIEDVLSEFRAKNYNYPKKSILFTWKYLLDNYQHCKQNYTTENARKMWKYFNLMDNCFDNAKPNTEKFNDKWILCFIESLNNHRPVVLKRGLTMDILQMVEDDFRKLGNCDINQKDIYNQWFVLKRVYKKYQSSNSKANRLPSYYSSLKEFFEMDMNEKPGELINQNELDTAVSSIITADSTVPKRRKIDESSLSNLEVEAKGSIPKYSSFTPVMQDILLQYLKAHKRRIQNRNGELDDFILDNICEEFRKHEYDISKSLICNEWNDLSCRYELIKNSENPEQWACFDDINYIYTSEEIDEFFTADDIGNDAESENIKNLLKTKEKVSVNDVKTSEKLLNIYECNNKEFLEIKDILVERNLLREETNYLLNIFVEKFNKEK